MTSINSFSGKTVVVAKSDTADYRTIGEAIENAQPKAHPGVFIDTGSNPTIRRCRIYDSKENGIWIHKSGLGTIEDCDIYGNTYPGVYIDTLSNPVIRGCRIYDGKQDGIRITQNSQGTIEYCDIYGNKVIFK